MDPISSEKKTNILIIGGGISGLTSALRLKEKDPSLQVTIIETTNTLGGQLRSTHLGEIGAKWITEDQCHIYRLLKYLQVPTNRRNVTSPQLKRCWEIDNGIWATLTKYELHLFIEELECKLELFKPGSEK